MDQRVAKVYCGASQIISSLGSTTEQVVGAIERYETLVTPFDDGTPTCRINRGALNLEGLEGYTFAEQLAIMALRDVERKSGVKLSAPSSALVLSTTKGNIDSISSDFDRSYLWQMGQRIAAYFGYSSRVVIISNACVSGVTAIAVATRMIERGEVDNAFVVGVDVVSQFVVSGFNSFKSLSPTLCRPYDESRDGLTIGEGCGALLLSCEESLSPHQILVAGYGLSDDANHISGPSRTGDGLHYAIGAAIGAAGVEPCDIGLINAHGTATPYNDDMESRAIHLSGLDGVPCNSLKPYLGHTLGASGVIEVIVAIEQMSRNLIFGVKGYNCSSLPHEMNLSGQHRATEIEHAVKCASGFGGTNAAVVLSKLSAYRANRVGERASVNISEIAHIHLSNSEEGAVERLKREYKELGEANLKFYKMNGLAKAGYVASCKMLRGVEMAVDPTRVAVVLGNRSSSLDADLQHQVIVDRALPEGASPAIFVYTLANIVAAEIAIKHRFQGESTTFVMEHKDMEWLKDYSEGLLREAQCDAVLYGWCELLHNDYDVELKLIKKI
ncbi:MAG: beta-ketoacyl synthase N-terminal-like domain-containing protein [Rikenellaceae bacterium]